MSRGEPEAVQMISVVVPARDSASTIAVQLEALQAQTYRGDWEIVVVDNGSTDATAAIAHTFAERLPLRIVDGSAVSGLNAVRNLGFEASRGDLIAYCDADDVASPGWLEGLAEAARDHDLVGGSLEYRSLNDDAALAPAENVHGLPRSFDFLPYVPGGNCAIRRVVFDNQRWGEAYGGGTEMEFSWNAQLNGFRLGYAPEAVMAVRLRSSIRDVMRQWFAYGTNGPALYKKFGAHGMPRATVFDAIKAWAWIALRVPDLMGGKAARGHWARELAFRCGRLVGSFRERVFFP
jgi:glycosyltransferase involved in cell wall biosynthesis